MVIRRREFYLALLILSHICLTTGTIWPHPKSITHGQQRKNITFCDFNQQPFTHSHINLKLNAILKEVFKIQGSYDCNHHDSTINADIIKIKLIINDPELRPPRSDENEQYTINISLERITIEAETFVGFLRSLQTLRQLVKVQKIGPKEVYYLENLPLEVSDEPAFPYRGIMIDSARHYLSKKAIMKVIDGMSLNKLNVLHWHITDDESFPLFISSYPNLTYYGAFSQNQIYSVQDVKDIIAYATNNGVRVIPEVDSPGHVRSWGLSPALSNITILCPNGEHYNNQIDPTMNLTYQVSDWIFTDLQNLFSDEYVHFGGDEVFGSCWDRRPSIQTFMAENNIPDYPSLQLYYRNRQKKILQKGKSAVYWSNKDMYYNVDPSEIIQYWGTYQSTNLLLNTTNRLILSSTDYLYITHGLGTLWGNMNGQYNTWKDIYSFNPLPPGFSKDRILGAEVCVWAETTNENTLENTLWPRTAAFAERLWNPINDTTINVAKRLSAMVKILNSKGILSSPVTTQYCQNHIDECFL